MIIEFLNLPWVPWVLWGAILTNFLLQFMADYRLSGNPAEQDRVMGYGTGSNEPYVPKTDVDHGVWVISSIIARYRAGEREEIAVGITLVEESKNMLALAAILSEFDGTPEEIAEAYVYAQEHEQAAMLYMPYYTTPNHPIIKTMARNRERKLNNKQTKG